MKRGERLLDLLYPPKCPFCRCLTARNGELCPRCRATLPWTEGEREGKADFVSRIAAPLYYEGAVRESLHRYKFEGVSGYAALYGRLMAETAQTRMSGCYDLISWVPLSRKRRKKRGYDQAGLLAKALGEALGKEPVGLLEKVRDVPPQSGAGGEAARRANISGCYRVADAAAAAGRRILLVDDIVTTGATLSECARVLRLAGAQEVLAVTLAMGRERSGKDTKDSCLDEVKA